MPIVGVPLDRVSPATYHGFSLPPYSVKAPPCRLRQMRSAPAPKDLALNASSKETVPSPGKYSSPSPAVPTYHDLTRKCGPPLPKSLSSRVKPTRPLRLMSMLAPPSERPLNVRLLVGNREFGLGAGSSWPALSCQ